MCVSKRNRMVLSLAVGLSLFNGVAHAQNNTSPYSILGIGDIESSYFNRTSGMANTGIALRNTRYSILNNPASLSAMDDQFFSFELALRGRYINYQGADIVPGNSTSRDFSVKRLSLAIKANKWWGTGIGFMPFSVSNYLFSAKKFIQGTTESTDAQYEGTGGVNQVYWANGFRIGKHFSAGVSLAYLFGSMSQTESVLSQTLAASLITTNNIYLHSPYFSGGAQYFTALGKHWDLALGGTYSRKATPKAEYSSKVSTTATDTLSYAITDNNYFKLPDCYGGGIALTKDKKYTFTADYRFQKWSDLQEKGTQYALVNSNRYSAGFELSQKRLAWGNVLVESMYYQAGLYYSNSYLQLYNQQIDEKGFTMGLGFNSKRNAMGVAFALDVGQRGTTTNGLIKETATSFSITISYRDFWNTKGKKYF